MADVKAKKPAGYFSKQAKAARQSARAARKIERENENKLRDVERSIRSSRQRQLIERNRQMGQPRPVDDRASKSAFDAERAEEKVRAAEWRRERRRRANKNYPNDKVDPVAAVSMDGKRVTVDERSGRFLRMLNRSKNPWPLRWVDAAIRFEREFSLAEYSGLSGVSFEPRVDGHGETKSALGIAARLKLTELRRRIGDESFVMLVLWCGHGYTLTDMHALSLGTTQTLGERLAEAVSKAAAFYDRQPQMPQSRFLEKCDLLLKEAARIV